MALCWRRSWPEGSAWAEPGLGELSGAGDSPAGVHGGCPLRCGCAVCLHWRWVAVVTCRLPLLAKWGLDQDGPDVVDPGECRRRRRRWAVRLHRRRTAARVPPHRDGGAAAVVAVVVARLGIPATIAIVAVAPLGLHGGDKDEGNQYDCQKCEFHDITSLQVNLQETLHAKRYDSNVKPYHATLVKSRLHSLRIFRGRSSWFQRPGLLMLGFLSRRSVGNRTKKPVQGPLKL